MSRTLTTLLLVFGFLLSAACFPVQAQQSQKIARIGWLTYGFQPTLPERYEAFIQALRELGYIEGRNFTIVRSNAGQKLDRFRDAAAELVRLKVDVIVTTGSTGAMAAKEATTTIPIVMTTGGDPVALGLISSLARPGGNITGLTSISNDLAGKRVELLKEIIPKLTTVGILWNPTDPGSFAAFKETEIAARALALQLEALKVRDRKDFESAFKTAIAKRIGALVIVQTALINDQRRTIIELATKNRLPTMFGEGSQVEAGGLMSYAPLSADLFRRAATYVDKILKGVKPADLPVEQPTKFEFVVNLKTAKQLGLQIPPEVLARANRIIR